jgi:hypothetical protein
MTVEWEGKNRGVQVFFEAEIASTAMLGLTTRSTTDRQMPSFWTRPNQAHRA